MTTTTLQPQRQNGLGLLTGLVLVIALAIVGFMILDHVSQPVVVQAVELPEIQVDPDQDHAVEQHGSIAYTVRECLNKNGAYQIYRSFDKKQFYALCQLPDGRWGMQEFMRDKIHKTWREITAFVPKDGSWDRVIEYLARSGTRFKGPFPWD